VATAFQSVATGPARAQNHGESQVGRCCGDVLRACRHPGCRWGLCSAAGAALVEAHASDVAAASAVAMLLPQVLLLPPPRVASSPFGDTVASATVLAALFCRVAALFVVPCRLPACRSSLPASFPAALGPAAAPSRAFSQDTVSESKGQLAKSDANAVIEAACSLSGCCCCCASRPPRVATSVSICAPSANPQFALL
jgi:hypothetical protein